MSLFDFFSEEEKKEYEMQYPDVGEYDDAQKLALEKDVLGIYAVSYTHLFITCLSNNGNMFFW